MVRSGRHRSLLLVAALLVVPVPAVGHAASPQADPEPRRTLTLITGDKVILNQSLDRQLPQVRPGEGRDDVVFLMNQIEGHVYVVPSDAMPLVNRGVVDRQLFDITNLIRYGHRDADRSDLPVLLEGDGAEAAGDDAGGTVTHSLPSVNAVALRQPKRSAGEFWRSIVAGSGLRPGVTRIWLDGMLQPMLDQTVPQIGAPQAWRSGFTGRGVKVAVLDTGIDATHPDLQGRIAETRTFLNLDDDNDPAGHGTHVAGTIAGAGTASDGRYRGVAPDATLLIGKVCTRFWCPVSAVLAGMQWVAESGATVVAMSLGGDQSEESRYDEPLKRAVDELTARYGTLFVAAAGNTGRRGDGLLTAQANADAALAVGAVDRSDQLADFSGRGPRAGDHALKPEITAPGVGVVAARAQGGSLGTPGESYLALSGTSAAAAHVAGAAAILAQQHPGWRAQELKAALVGSAQPHPELGAYAQGSGRVDVARAVSQSGYATPPVVSAGLALWPHHDDPTLLRTVTYHNPGSEPVSYRLTLRSLGPDGNAAPDGMFATSTGTVTVPAGGTATVQVRVETRTAQPGLYSAWLIATAGEARLTTPVAVNVESERYALTFNLTDRNGQPASVYRLRIFDLDRRNGFYWGGPPGTVTVRVPPGRYAIDSTVYTSGPEDHTSAIVWPKFELSRDSTVELDARDARINQVAPFDPQARLDFAVLDYSGPGLRGGLGTNDLSQVSTLHLGPDDDQVSSRLMGTWYTRSATRQFERVFCLVYHQRGRLMTGFSRTVPESELAAIRSSYHAHAGNRVGFKAWYFRAVGTDSPVHVSEFGFRPPLAVTEYVNVDGLQWESTYLVMDYDEVLDFAFFSSGVRYQVGRRYQEAWNNAVSGPGFGPRFPGPSRTGNQIDASVPMAADGAGHPANFYPDQGTTSLYRDGQLVDTVPSPGAGVFTVPAEVADYRLTVDATRDGVWYSTTISCAWSFRSGHTDTRTALPLLAVGFAPDVDLTNRAEAGESQQVPVTVSSATGTPVAVTSLTVEVSFDDGVTWHRVGVVRSLDGEGWYAPIHHPTDGEYVSLRARAVDSDGNSVEQTIIRAYGLA